MTSPIVTESSDASARCAPQRRVAPEVFERRYRSSRDPWGYATSMRHRRRLDLLAATLPTRRSRSPSNLGCSTGELTRPLADRADRVVGWDASRSAVRRTRVRCAHRPDIRIAFGALPEFWPDRQPDLIVFSELLYYFERATIDDVAHRAVDTFGSPDAFRDAFGSAAAGVFGSGWARQGFRRDRDRHHLESGLPG